VNDFYEFMGEHVFDADLSVSVPMLDSLMEPKGVIAEAQAMAAKAFGARRTFFATNGTSTANKVIFQTLEGHLRSILGTLTVEELNYDRAKFQQEVQSAARSDLATSGLTIDNFTIQAIRDEVGYMDLIGQQETARRERDARPPRGQPFTYGRIAGLYDSSLRLFGFTRAVEQFLERVDWCLPPRPRALDAGAEVVIDGIPRGTTPFSSKDITPDATHAITVKKDGFEAHERMISGSDWSRPRGGVQSLKFNVKLRKTGGEAAKPRHDRLGCHGLPCASPSKTPGTLRARPASASGEPAR